MWLGYLDNCTTCRFAALIDVLETSMITMFEIEQGENEGTFRYGLLVPAVWIAGMVKLLVER